MLDKFLINIVAGGGVIRQKPKVAKKKQAEKGARKGLEAVVSDCKKEQDLRTLYIRFKTDSLPAKEEDVRALHPKVVQVRISRQAWKAEKTAFSFCFVEFGSEKECEEAKQALSEKEFNGGSLYVDFVGAKSKGGASKKSPSKAQMPINPTRLFVSGAHGLTSSKLKELFPTCLKAEVPQRSKKKLGAMFGFVQFSSPADAKAAFEASKDLVHGGAPLQVLFSRMDKNKKPSSPEKESSKSPKAEKRARKGKKTNEEKGPSKKAKKEDVPAKDEEDEEASDSEVENDGESAEEDEDAEKSNDEGGEVGEEEEEDEDEADSDVENDADSSDDE
jgi:hypothetical protein